MQDVYLLTVNDNAHPGYEVLVTAFVDEVKLKEYLAQHVTLSPGAVPGVLIPAFDKMYKIQKMKADAGAVVDTPEATAIDAPDVELPYVSITVPSQSDPNETYGVSVNMKGEVEGCTCPQFQYRNENQCKHMMTVCYQESPYIFGVPHLTIAREFY